MDTEVIAALVGAGFGWFLGILGSVVLDIKRNFGKLIIFTNQSKYSGYILSTSGDYVGSSDIRNATHVRISIDIDVYNQSDIPRTLGGFQVELREKWSGKLFTPEVRKDKRLWSDDIEPLPTQTIFPRQPAKIIGYLNFDQKEFLLYESKVSVYLLAKTPGKKGFRAKILEIEE